LDIDGYGLEVKLAKTSIKPHFPRNPNGGSDGTRTRNDLLQINDLQIEHEKHDKNMTVLGAYFAR
jgi:hypothetical protein